MTEGFIALVGAIAPWALRQAARISLRWRCVRRVTFASRKRPYG